MGKMPKNAMRYKKGIVEMPVCMLKCIYNSMMLAFGENWGWFE
jgi:hypothetical protein